MFANFWLAIKGIFAKKTMPTPPLVTPVVVTPEPVLKAFSVPSFPVASSGRKLEVKLETIIDTVLMKNKPLAFQKACESKDGNELVALANEALEILKVREKTNSNDGVMVDLINETVGSADKAAWCMAEQMTCIAYAEKKIGVKSLVPASESTISVAHDSPSSCRVMAVEQSKSVAVKAVKLANCKRGDIWIWQHGTAWKGHTGCFMKWVKNGSIASLVEGNTTAGKAGDKIVREGGGTYFTERSTGQIGDMKLIAVIRAF